MEESQLLVWLNGKAQICLSWMFHVNGIIWYIVSGFFSLSITFLRLTYFVACHSIPFLLQKIYCMELPHFIYPVDRHLDCQHFFWLWWIMLPWRVTYTLLNAIFSALLGGYLWVEFLGHIVTLTFRGNVKLFSKWLHDFILHTHFSYLIYDLQIFSLMWFVFSLSWLCPLKQKLFTFGTIQLIFFPECFWCHV